MTSFRRRHLLVLLPFLATALAFNACTAWKRFAYEGFDRDSWQQPQRVVDALDLTPGERVADLGAGGGYFTFRLARAVGTDGRIYAVDVDEGLLRYIRERAADEGLSQIETVLAGPQDSHLPPHSVDLIFVSNTYHHLPDPPAYFSRLRDRLRPGGRIAVVEMSSGSFPPGHVTPPEAIRADLEAAGYSRATSYDFLDHQSFQIFAVRPTMPHEAPPPSGGSPAAGRRKEQRQNPQSPSGRESDISTFRWQRLPTWSPVAGPAPPGPSSGAGRCPVPG